MRVEFTFSASDNDDAPDGPILFSFGLFAEIVRILNKDEKKTIPTDSSEGGMSSPSVRLTMRLFLFFQCHSSQEQKPLSISLSIILTRTQATDSEQWVMNWPSALLTVLTLLNLQSSNLCKNLFLKPCEWDSMLSLPRGPALWWMNWPSRQMTE